MTLEIRPRIQNLADSPLPEPGSAPVEASEIAKLCSEHDFLLKVLDHMDALLVVLDGKGRILRFNRACERLFGYTTQQIRQKLTTGELPLPQEVGEIKSLLASIRAGQNEGQYESDWQTSDGQSRTIAWTISCFPNDQGSPEYIFATGTDITSRKTAERLLQQEQALINGLIDSIPDLIFYKDPSGAYIGCNGTFEQFRGTSRENIIGLTDADIYSPQLAKEFIETDRQVIAKHESILYENWTTGPNQQAVLIETRKTPFYSQDGETLGVLGVGRDITHHRMVENALRAAHLEIEHLINSLSSILIVLAADTTVMRWNPTAQSVFGISSEEALGQPLRKLPIIWDWKQVIDALYRCSKEGAGVYPPPLRFKRGDGREGYMGLNISPFLQSQKQVGGFILLGNDITERKILESRLAQAQKLESIGQLAAGIAHEINTPIQYIGSNLSFLEESFQELVRLLQPGDQTADAGLSSQAGLDLFGPAPAAEPDELDYLCAEIPEAIRQSLEGIAQVSEIVAAMRSFSHPGIKEKKYVDLNSAVENTVAVSRNEWKYVAEVALNLEPDLPKVCCLPNEINQVFLNIIVNAAHAIAARPDRSETEKGTITITTRLEGDTVAIQVADTGAGIPEAIQHRIFEPFFTTKDVGKGTGQGLAIAYDVVERKHKGMLTFESQPGKGTVFTVRLPVHSGDEGKVEKV